MRDPENVSRGSRSYVEDELASAEPAGDPASSRPSFDPIALLGSSAKDVFASAGESVGLAIDPDDKRLAEILEQARRLGADSASLMLAAAGGKHLQVAAALGLDKQMIAAIRRRVGEGIAGQAFATVKPAIGRGQVPALAEMSGRPLCRVAASVPVMISGRPVGVLSINVTSEEAIPDPRLVPPLKRLAREIPLAILAAVDLRTVPQDKQIALLQCLIDRIMSLEEALPTRLAALCECLRKMVGAESVRCYLFDPVDGEFHEMTLPAQAAASGESSRWRRREFLTRVMRHGYPVVLESEDPEDARKTMTIGYPIRASDPNGLVVLENIPAGLDQEQLLATLREVFEQLESMISIEENVAAQELVAELHMRIADLESELDSLPPPDRARALLALAVELVAAEVAIWISADGESLMTPCQTPDALRIQKWASGCLEALRSWAQANGALAEGMVATSWDDQAPSGPAPYVAVPDAEGGGALIVLFGPAELAEASRQLPTHVMWEVLRRLSTLIAGQREDLISEEVKSAHVLEAHRILTAPMFAKIMQHEFNRSRRYGHTCSLIRVRLSGPGVNDADSEMLIRFLLEVTRQLDIISETSPGVFAVLLPQTGADPDLIQRRLVAKWQTQHPGLELDVEQRNFLPFDDEAAYREWIDAEGGISESAA